MLWEAEAADGTPGDGRVGIHASAEWPPRSASDFTRSRSTLVPLEDAMETQNVTVSLPKDVLLRVKVIAAQRQVDIELPMPEAAPPRMEGGVS
jgi:hypothetical protein